MRGLSYTTKIAAVADRLRNEILGGALPAGTPLQQEEVAARLSVSPTPVREAFRILEAEGLLESRPHHGVVVARHDYADVRAIYEIRTFVELKALERAIEHINTDTLEALEETVVRSRRALEKDDVRGFRVAIGDFHRVLVDASGSRVFSDLGRSLIDRSTRFPPLLMPARTSEIVGAHDAILRALKANRRSRVLEIMARHMNANLRTIPKSGAPVTPQRGRRAAPKTATAAASPPSQRTAPKIRPAAGPKRPPRAVRHEEVAAAADGTTAGP